MADLVRGAVVLVSGDGEAAARPCVVVQSDTFNPTHGTVSLCPLTGLVGGERLFRVPVSPSEANNLPVAAEVQVDKVAAVARARVSAPIGHLSATRMEQVDQALRRWLGL